MRRQVESTMKARSFLVSVLGMVLSYCLLTTAATADDWTEMNPWASTGPSDPGVGVIWFGAYFAYRGEVLEITVPGTPGDVVTVRTYQQRFACADEPCFDWLYQDTIRIGANGETIHRMPTRGLPATTYRFCWSADWPQCRTSYHEVFVLLPQRQCRSGYVWREAFDGDYVCVSPQTRTQARNDNAQAAARVNPGGGAYGQKTCRSGYVWREAGLGDYVCVTPAVRSQAAQDNAEAENRWQPQ